MARRENGPGIPGPAVGRGRSLFGALVGNIDGQALVPVVALYALALGADIALAGLIVGAYSIVHAPANLVGGRLVDRFGRRTTLLVGLLADAGSLVLYALSRNPTDLLLARAVHGLGGGLIGPATMSLVADTASRGRRGRTMALYGIALGLSVIVGFGLAGGLVLASDDVVAAIPRLATVLIALLLIGVTVSVTLPEGRRRPRAPWSEVGALIRRPALLAGFGLIFCLYFAVGSFATLFPAQVETWSPDFERTVVLSFVAFGVVSVVLHYPAGLLADRRGPRLAALAGIAALAVGFVTLPLVTTPALLLAPLTLLGAGHAFVFPSASALVSAAPRDQLGVATGALFACLVGGVAIGAPAMGYAASVLGVSTALAVTALVALPAVAVAIAVPRGWEEGTEESAPSQPT